jgi:hypothetical protein
MYGDAHSGLDISVHDCDFYLVLSGSRQSAGAVSHRRWHIANVHLLAAEPLRAELEARGVRIGIATSVRSSDLLRAEIYPASGVDAVLTLTDGQRQLLSLFA